MGSKDRLGLVLSDGASEIVGDKDGSSEGFASAVEDSGLLVGSFICIGILLGRAEGLALGALEIKSLGSSEGEDEYVG